MPVINLLPLSSKCTFLALLWDSRSGPYNTSLLTTGAMSGFINIEQWRDTTRPLRTFWYTFLHWCNCQLNTVWEARWPSPQRPEQTSSGLVTFSGKFLHYQSGFQQRLALVTTILLQTLHHLPASCGLPGACCCPLTQFSDLSQSPNPQALDEREARDF